MGVPPDISDSCRLALCHLGMGEGEGQEGHPLPLSRVVVQLVPTAMLDRCGSQLLPLVWAALGSFDISKAPEPGWHSAAGTWEHAHSLPVLSPGPMPPTPGSVPRAETNAALLLLC